MGCHQWIVRPSHRHGLYTAPPRPLVHRLYQGASQASQGRREIRSCEASCQYHLTARYVPCPHPSSDWIVIVVLRTPNHPECIRTSRIVHVSCVPRTASYRAPYGGARTVGSTQALENERSVQRYAASGSGGPSGKGSCLPVRRVGDHVCFTCGAGSRVRQRRGVFPFMTLSHLQ